MYNEFYTPVVIGVNGVASLPTSALQVAGFLAKTTGAITITNRRGVTIVDAVPVTAGTFTFMPFSLRGGSAGNEGPPVVTLSGGASGTFCY